MLYTTTPLARSQSTSQVFLDHGIQNEAPGAVSDLRISVITTGNDLLLAWFIQLIWMLIGAFYTELPVATEKTVSILGSKFSTGLFRAPPLVITFPKKPSEEIQQKLAELGFILQTKNHYNYYKGPASESNLTTVIQMGAHADAYAEFGCTNANGYTALIAIDNLLYGVLMFIHGSLDIAKKLKEQKDVEKTILYNDNWSGPTFISSKDQLPEKGILVPYFHGLLISDKAAPIKFILDKFHRCLGNTPAEIIRNTAILNDGWLSLSTSGCGQAISHLLFGISLAMDGQLDLQVLYINGQYSGYVLSGKGFAILKGKTVVKPVDNETLMMEFDMLNKHDASLAEIATILSGVNLRTPLSESITGSDGKVSTVEVSQLHCSLNSIATPRKLYNAICLRKMTPEDIKSVQVHVLKLEFLQTFWDVTNPEKVALAVKLLCGKSTPSEDAPFAYKTAALYNLSNIASVLACFGPIAPTVTDNDSGNGVVPLQQNARTYEEAKGFTLHGAPIFRKSLQNAIEDWDKVLSSGVIRFKHSGNDKMGRVKINAGHTIIPKGSKPYEMISTALGVVAKRNAELNKKRKRQDEPHVDPLKEEERHSKKSKKDGVLLAVLGEPSQAMEVDSREEF